MHDLSANHFLMALENGIQIRFPFFVFCSREKNGFDFRFSFSHYIENQV